MKPSKRIEELKEKVALLPQSPGVYQFLGSDGQVIYVGKAKNLHRRVYSYFTSKANESPKVRVMVSRIADLRHTVVSSESEAFLLENNMIKSLQPRYNILLKDDKTYPWIVIRNEPFPRVQSTRRLVRDGSQYFGPYASVYVQKAVLDMAHSIHSLRTCSLNLSPEAIAKNRYSVCLQYHIGNCKGPCVGLQGEEDYRRSVGMVASLLRGDTRDTMRYLKEKMSEASEAMRFEEAAQYKKRIEILTSYQSKSVVVSNTLTNMDVFSLVTDEDAAFCNFMRIADGAVVNSFTVELKPGLEDTPRDVLTYAIGTIAERLSGKLSREVIVPFPPSGSLWENVAFTVPQRGDKLRLLELSERNARLYRLEKLKQIEIKDPRPPHEPYSLDAATGAPPERAAPPYRMFRQLEPARNQPGGLLRRVSRRQTVAKGIPAFQHQDGRRSERLRLDGRGDRPPLQPAARRGRRASRADRRRRRQGDSSDSPTRRCNGSDWNTK